MKFSHQIYLRNDIPCGYKECDTCQNSSYISYLDEISFEDDEIESEKIIYILDFDLLMNQIDFIEHCSVLKNSIVIQSVLSELQLKSKYLFRKPKQYEILRNLVEVEVYRKIYLFPNEFSKFCHLPQNSGENKEIYMNRLIFNCCNWFKSHLEVFLC